MSANIVPSLSCDEVRDSLDAYALGAVDPDELDAIEEHLALCPECRNVLARALQTVEALALAVHPVEPSQGARERLLATASETPAPVSVEPIPIDIARSRRATGRLGRLLLPAMSVAAALLLVGVGVLGVLLNRALEERDDARSTAQMLSTYVSAGGQVVTMQAQPASIYKSYKGQGSLLMAPGMEPVVVVAGCPESGDFLTYWVWFARGNERTPAGKLTVGDDGSGWMTLDPDLPLAEFDTIGITVVLADDAREDVLVAPLKQETVNQG
jgi:hypothetical protein